MKVYLVEHAYGDFDSYRTYGEKVFLNKKSAKKYMKEFDSMHTDFKPTIPEEIWDNVMDEYYENKAYDGIGIHDANNKKYVHLLYEILTTNFGHTEYSLEDVKNMVYYDEEIKYQDWHKSRILEYEVIED